MRLEFSPPLMPTLVEKPPESADWIHEVKFDGYRSQIVRDREGVRIFTRRGLDWTAARERAGAAGVGILKTANSLPILAEGAIAWARVSHVQTCRHCPGRRRGQSGP
ncbi:ATP-dependent DNA ligase [Mesorhizobium sp. f-mel]